VVSELSERLQVLCDANAGPVHLSVIRIILDEVIHRDTEMKRLRIAGRRLLSVLPDSVTHENHDCWRWCWDELDGDGQDEVKAARNLWEKALGGE